MDASLTRLGTDHIDYYLLHRPDVLSEPEEVASAVDKLYRSGKVLHFDVSNQNSMQMACLKRYVSRPLEVNQLQLSPAHTLLFDSGINVNRVESSGCDRDLGIFNYCLMNNCAVQAWSPFRAAKSVFTGGIIDRFGRKKIETRAYLGSDEFPELNGKLRELAEKYAVTPGAIVVAWILSCPGRMQVVLGSTRRGRIAEACAGVDIALTREEWYRLYVAGGNYSV